MLSRQRFRMLPTEAGTIVPDTLRMFPMQVLRQPTVLVASWAETPAPSRSAVSSADLASASCAVS